MRCSRKEHIIAEIALPKRVGVDGPIDSKTPRALQQLASPILASKEPRALQKTQTTPRLLILLEMADRKLLNGWKEIANYLGRAVRSVQRYEADLKLPVRRPKAADHSGVFAFSDELDEWLQRATIKSQPYVRPILIVIDPPDAHNVSQRKLALELEKFNVLTAFSEAEALATAQRIDVDGFVVNCASKKTSPVELCDLLKERYPKKKIFAVLMEGKHRPRAADYAIQDDPRLLIDAVLKCFGKPRLQ